MVHYAVFFCVVRLVSLEMFRVLTRITCIGSIGIATASYTFYQHRTLRCESNQSGTTTKLNTSTGFGKKLFGGFVDITNKLSDGIKNGDLFHELKRKEVQMELLYILLPLLFGAFTSYRVYLKRIKSQKQALNKWNRKDFHDVLNISLNTICRSRVSTLGNSLNGNPFNYHIHYRTLIEKDAKSVINDEEGIGLLTSTMQKCVDENEEIIRVDGKHKDDRDAHWAICSAVMNQISNLCSYGYIYRDLLLYDKLKASKDVEYCDMNDLEDEDLGVVSCDYVMALTCEGSKYRVAKTNKIRVILINKNMLQIIIDDYKNNVNQDLNDIADDVWMMNLENLYQKDMFRDWNKKRWLLIKKIAQIYDKQLKINNKLDWANPLADLELVVVKTHDNLLQTDASQSLLLQKSM